MLRFHAARPHGCHQGFACQPFLRSFSEAAPGAGGQSGFQALPSPHLHAVRRRPQGRHGFSRHGISGRRDPGTPSGKRPAATRADDSLRCADCQRPGQSTQAGHYPSRSEARERQSALRNGDREASLFRNQPGQLDCCDPHHRAPVHHATPAAYARNIGARREEVPRERPRRPLAKRRRSCQRASVDVYRIPHEPIRDGRRIAFVAGSPGKSQMYIQSLDAPKASALTGTEGASWPFWSPDSRSLGFFAHGQLKRIDAEGGSPIDICEARVPRGASWGADGIVVFTPETTTGLYRVSASGGQPVPVTTTDPQLDSHRWPFFLPDGKHFLYYAASHNDIGHERDSIYVASIDGGPSNLLLHSHANAAYANGHLLFVKDNALMAQPFDVTRLELSGDPVVVQDGIEEHRTWWMAIFSASQNGTLVFAPVQNLDNNLLWMDSTGKPLGTVGEPGRYASLHLSPDESRLVIERDRPHHDLWLYDLRRNDLRGEDLLPTQFTAGVTAGLPVWSNDGAKIAFAAEKAGTFEI